MAEFRDPILKLQRAKRHISDLVAKSAKFYNSMTTSFFIEDDAQAHKRTLRVKINEAVPNDISLIIGDAIHNMRSALDHLTWDVLRPFNPIADKVQFPFCKKAENFESVLRNRQVHLAGEKIAQKFRELKPYPGGNDLLYALHLLDVADKHELVVPVISWFGFDTFDLQKFDPSAPAYIREKVMYNLYKDNRLAVWGYDPSIPWSPPKLAEDIKLTVQITFQKEMPFGGKSIPSILRRMAMEVSSAIRKFRD